MDTPTHGLIGRLAARAIWPNKSDTGLVNVVTVCSVLPDLDVFFPGQGLEGLVTHRGFSHSLLGVAIGAVAVAWLAQKLKLKHLSFAQLYIAAIFGMLMHIFFDAVTTYGTLVFVPFSNYRVALDVLFIIDPYLDILLIAGLLLGWRYTRLAYRWGAGAVTVYVMSAALITGIGHVQARAWVKEKGISAEQVMVMPSPFSPLHRRGMVVSDKKVFWIPISLFQGVYGDVVEYVEARSDERLAEMWASRSGMIYGWFVRVPVVKKIEGDREVLLIQDLQFMPRPEGLGWLGAWAARLVLDHQFGVFERTIFALEIELDDLNNVRKIIYLGQNGERHPL